MSMTLASVLQRRNCLGSKFQGEPEVLTAFNSTSASIPMFVPAKLG